MGELIKTIAEALVEQPEAVVVKEEETEHNINIKLSVADNDMGRVIGKSGRIAKALRTVVKAAATGSQKRVNLEIINLEE